MRRREFITLVGVAAVMGASAAWAQQAAKLPTIGFSGPALWAPAFEQRLRETGWVAARTVAIEYRSAEGHNDRYDEFATEFVRLKVNVIVTVGGSSTLAAKRATLLMPIVFVSGDPVGSGVVASLARSDSNATGIMGHPNGLAGKRLELLREVLPSFRRLSVMVNANIPGFQRGDPKGILSIGQQAQSRASLALRRRHAQHNILPRCHALSLSSTLTVIRN
jgi:putative tryptophan/tyrosine transport system substrate-binding protein